MENKFMTALKNETNLTYTENGALTHKSSLSGLMDLFALGAAYRSRSDEDVILLFKNAFEENPEYALKCLFYIADCRGGQGERRFFKVCARWLAVNHTETMRRNLAHVPHYTRWDNMLIFLDTPLEKDVMNIIKKQIATDVNSKYPSLLTKWLPSENASSKETKKMARKVRKHLGFTSKQYRQVLSHMRSRINVLEKLMSSKRWSEIEFDKIPSKAGLKYKEAFIKHDPDREAAGVRTYADFINDKNTTVNAKTLYPYEVVAKALNLITLYYNDYTGRYEYGLPNEEDTNRVAVNKYWDNLTDYFADKTFDGLAVVDTSGSMHGYNAAAPINVAISLGLYCAERAKGPFHGHFVSFSERPQLIKVEGVDFCDEVARIYETNLVANTNIEATFDLLLDTALRYHCEQKDLPKSLIVISDMEFDRMRDDSDDTKTLMENIKVKWENCGFEMPNLVYWNVNARNNNFPQTLDDGITYVSGMSPVIFQQILSGKTSTELMFEVLDSDRYSIIH